MDKPTGPAAAGRRRLGAPRHESFKEQFDTEIRHLRALRHTHIIGLFGKCHGCISLKKPESAANPKRDMLVMELCQHGSVSQLLSQDILCPDPRRRNLRQGCHVLGVPQRHGLALARQRLAWARVWFHNHSPADRVVTVDAATTLTMREDDQTRVEIDDLMELSLREWNAVGGMVSSRDELIARCAPSRASARVVAEVCPPPTSWVQRLGFAVGAAKGLAYLHERKIVHSDIKADNVLIANGDVAKLCDFAFSKLRAFGQDENQALTPGYAPPEGPGGKAGDVFSFGVFLVELVSSLRPLQGNADWPQRQCTVVPTEAQNAVYCERGIGHSSLRHQSTGIPLADWYGPGSDVLLAEYSEITAHCTSWDDPQQRPSMADVAKRLGQLQRSKAYRAHRSSSARLLGLAKDHRTATAAAATAATAAASGGDGRLVARSQRSDNSNVNNNRRDSGRGAQLMEPSFLADVDPSQKQELLTLLSQATRHYGSVTRDAKTDVANKFGLSLEEVEQVITWAEGGQTPIPAAASASTAAVVAGADVVEGERLERLAKQQQQRRRHLQVSHVSATAINGRTEPTPEPEPEPTLDAEVEHSAARVSAGLTSSSGSGSSRSSSGGRQQQQQQQQQQQKIAHFPQVVQVQPYRGSRMAQSWLQQNAAEGQALSRRQQQYEEAVDDCDLREEEFYKAGGGAQRRK